MKPLYNSNKGRTARPRKEVRKVGQMPKSLMDELKSMSPAQSVAFKITAAFGLINLGVDILKLS